MTINSETLTAYALGILSSEEEARVQAALERDPALRAQIRAEEEALLSLVESLPEVEPPAGAEDRLLTRLRAEREERAPPAVQPTLQSVSLSAAAPRPRRVPWLSLSALGLAAALALAFVLRPAADPFTQYARTKGAVVQPLQPSGVKLGDLVRLPDGRAYLHLSAPPESGRIYQMWQIQGKTPVSLGVFDGQGFLLTNLPAGATVAVSIEPLGGSAQPTTTPILVQEL